MRMATEEEEGAAEAFAAKQGEPVLVLVLTSLSLSGNIRTTTPGG